MGSGETSPTMVKTHRSMLARVEPPAVLLDTPFGFQENADDIAAKAVEYFRESVGASISVASVRTADGADPLAYEAVRTAGYVFAGPGSPSYALRQWRDSPVPGLLHDKLRSGGCIVFASAAALTLGLVTVPVYEVYKVGEEPRWLEGLDLLGEAGLRAAVIPHFNNAEGGNHDTRYCYLGERRLRLLETDLPDDAFVLGVDEHTGLVLDLDESTAAVVGLGGVTVRRGGQSAVVPTGSVVGIEELAGMASTSAASSSSSAAPAAATREAPAAAPAASPLLARVAELEAEFGRGEIGARSVLALEEELVAWSRDTLQSDEMDRARGALRSMIARLAVPDRTPIVAPFVEALLVQRAAAREAGRWADADAVRDALAGLGVEARDSPQGTTWRLLS
jgi:cyanophycinase-like exopeptidase